MTGKKRLDLQGIRGLAILAVLGFHFYPDFFPNGYLGVDQFFVLSGFLMCMLLKRSENEAPCTLISLFYSKRFKRILPLYLILIFISMIALYSFFPDTAIKSNQESANRALLFVSNRPASDEEDYFQLLSTAIDIFTHTWSLSVEIQFYFLVPFLFLLGARFSDQKFLYGYYGFSGLISLIFFFISPDTVAFNSVFARIWQFLIGMMVYLASNPISKSSDTNSALKSVSSSKLEYRKLENQESDEELGGDPGEKENEEDKEEEEDVLFPEDVKIVKSSNQKEISYIPLTILILVVIYPLPEPAEIVRPLITFGTGFLMMVSDENLLLSNRLLTYIGDISYSLYLIHWPIYAYWKLTCDGDQKLLFLSLVSSIILAVICFETYEKWYLKLSSTSIGILCIILFTLNVLVINKDHILDRIDENRKNITSLDHILGNMTTDDAIKINHQWNLHEMLWTSSCKHNGKGTGFGLCHHVDLPKNGKYKLALIGNSFAANHGQLFHQECSYKAKSVMQLSNPACEPLYPTVRKSWPCKQRLKEFEENLAKEKPDYAFIVTRYVTIGEPFLPNVTNFFEDPIYQIMKTQMLKYTSNIKYKLFILDAIPRINTKVVEQIAPLIKNGTDPKVIDNLLVFPDKYEMVKRRHAQLVKDCKGKCELIDYIPSFYNTKSKTFRYFDEKGFSYWTSSEHLTPHGLEHVRHVWTGICREL